jgi:hypothetical protein
MTLDNIIPIILKPNAMEDIYLIRYVNKVRRDYVYSFKEHGRHIYHLTTITLEGRR